ncbi:MAG: hypothetical protein KC502_20425 [Myxococcales bacterium]|nr:hypothetical protein [Myxococcales bacterium]
MLSSSVLLSLLLAGCGASHQVTAADQAKAQSQFEAIDARHKALNKTMEKRLAGITTSALKPDAKYAFRRQAMKKHSTEARKVLAAYVRLANSLPKDKFAHQWTYAAFVRGAFIFDDMGGFARRLSNRYGAEDQKAEAAYFAGIAKAAFRGAYAGYMRVLFLADHYHKRDAADPIHGANAYLTTANRQRCVVSRAEKLSEVEHKNLTWGMFDSAHPSQLHVSKSDLRGELMKFMEIKRFGYCAP